MVGLVWWVFGGGGNLFMFFFFLLNIFLLFVDCLARWLLGGLDAGRCFEGVISGSGRFRG